MEVRILSVRQPYADQIIFGDKWNELRSWKTPYRGTICIHASRWEGQADRDSPGDGVTGAIIGQVQVLDCLSEEMLDTLDAHLHSRAELTPELKPLAKFLKKFTKSSWRHGIGAWNWILAEPLPLATPIPILGS